MPDDATGRIQILHLALEHLIVELVEEALLPDRMISLAGRSALVTGGSRGIGRAVALLLARAGADVAITYHSRTAEAETVAGEIRGLGRRAATIGGDLADPEVCDRMADEVRKAFGRLDCFVANAGIWPADDVPLATLSLERWRLTMAANLDGLFLSTRAALRIMGEGGRIVLDLEHGRAARRGIPCRLRCHQGCRHRAHQVPRGRVRAPYSRQLCRAGMGRYGDVCARLCR